MSQEKDKEIENLKKFIRELTDLIVKDLEIRVKSVTESRR